MDCRDVITKEVLSADRYTDMYVVKTHRHRAVLEPDYFIKMIEVCESKKDDEIKRVEEGIEDLTEGMSMMHASRSDVGGFSDWERI